MTREQWAPGSELMTSLQNEGILVAMDGITQQLTLQVARRTIELRNLHSRVTGQKDSALLVKALHRRYPQITKLISEYNQLSGQLPQECAIGTIDTKVFTAMMAKASNPELGSAERYQTQDTLFLLTLRKQGLGQLSLA